MCSGYEGGRWHHADMGFFFIEEMSARCVAGMMLSKNLYFFQLLHLLAV